MSSRPASLDLANHLVAPESEGLMPTIEMAGRTPFALLEKCDRHTSSSKTFAASSRPIPPTVFVGYESGDGTTRIDVIVVDSAEQRWMKPQKTLFGTSEPFSETFPVAGFLLDGECFPLRKWGLRIGEIGSGLWPTHTVKSGAQTAENPTPGQTGGTTLLGAVRRSTMWPTPSTMDHIERKGMRPSREATNRKTGYLSEMVVWPTPTAVTDTGGAALCKWGGSGAREQLRKIVSEKELNGALNPVWVSWLMNWPMGWTSLEPLAPADMERWLMGQWWDVDPATVGYVPRVAKGIPDRVNRLKALGNGQVPVCAAVAWILLTSEIT